MRWLYLCRISASLDHRDSRPQSPRTRWDGWTAASLQYISDVRIYKCQSPRGRGLFRTCSLAPDDCRRDAGWQIRVSLGAKYNELKKSFVKSIRTVDPTGKEGR